MSLWLGLAATGCQHELGVRCVEQAGPLAASKTCSCPAQLVPHRASRLGEGMELRPANITSTTLSDSNDRSKSTQ
eukprot:g8182.t1